MANFEETRFLGLTPRAIGLTLVAGAIVVGLFFIPETVKMLFDGKAKVTRSKPAAEAPSKVASSGRSGDSGSRASLSQSLLSRGASDSENRGGGDGKAVELKDVKKASEGDDARSSGPKGGIFSGWDFQVRARNWDSKGQQAPSNLTFERIISKEGSGFFKQSRGSIQKFLKQEGLSGTVADEEIQPLRDAINAVAVGDSKGPSSQEVAAKLRASHIQALRGLRAAGGDRGVLLRWLDLPVISFIDSKGGINAEKRIRETFNPGMTLAELSVRQRKQRGWGSSAVNPATFKADLSVASSDVEKIVAYSNGKPVKTYTLRRSKRGEPRMVHVSGDASGVWTFVARDSFGARPYSKSYSFYPKASVFKQNRDGSFQIGFLPGSGRNSLDRFFLVGATKRDQPSDSMISTF